MGREPLLSVIIPVYNVEKYISECLHSICNQTYGNLEIIVINDGTKDNSAEIAKEFAVQDSRIKVYDYPNAGLSAARNRGLARAIGDYVAFVDSDDYLDVNTFSKSMDLICKHDLDILKFGVREFNTQTGKENIIAFPEDKFLLKPFDKYYFNGFLFTIVCNAIYKKSVVDDIKFPLNVVHEDNFASGLYLVKAKNIMVTKSIFYNYRFNNNGISKGG